jgi:hypothetical protein
MDALRDNTLPHHLKCVLMDAWKQQRQPLETKWDRNLQAFRRMSNNVDPELIPWAKDVERHRPWMSLACSDVTKTKVIAGKVAVTDIMLRGGRVQFALLPDDLGSSVVQAAPTEGSQPAETDVTEGMFNAIQRQLEGCDAEGELGSGVLDGALYGLTWTKYYVHKLRDERYVETAPASNVFALQATEQDAPALERKSPWAMYWDMESDGPRDGEGVVEEDYLSCDQARQLKSKPLYIAKAIQKVVDGKTGYGSSGQNAAAATTDPPKRRNLQKLRRTIWRGEFWATVPLSLAQKSERDLMEHWGLAEIPGLIEYPDPELAEDQTADDVLVDVMVTMLEDEIVRYARVSKADRPYYLCVWEENPDGAGGLSVADNVEQEFLSLTKVTRALHDVLHMVSRLTFAGKRSKIDGDLKVVDPGDFIDLAEDARNVSEAIEQFVVQGPVAELMRAMEMFLSMADFSSQIPRAQSGQENTTPQTWSELRERLNRASTYMGDVFRHYDEMIEDIIRDFLTFNMADKTLPVKKLSMRVKALGFASYYDRKTRLANIFDLMDRVLNSPELARLCKVSPLAREAFKLTDVDPDTILKTAEELQAEADQQQQLIQAQQASAKPASGQDIQTSMALLAKLRAEADRARADAELKAAAAEDKRTDASIKKAEAVAALTPPAPQPSSRMEAFVGGQPVVQQGA